MRKKVRKPTMAKRADGVKKERTPLDLAFSKVKKLQKKKEKMTAAARTIDSEIEAAGKEVSKLLP